MIGVIYLVITVVVALVGVVGSVSYAILAEESDYYDIGLFSVNDNEDRWFFALLGPITALCFSPIWPVAVIGGLVAAPALVVRHRRDAEAKARAEQAAGLRSAAEMFERGSDEWKLLRDAATEAER